MSNALEGTMETTVRPLHAIARDIKANWADPYFGAVPYIQAMNMMVSVTDRLGEDSGKDIVAYFLSNARTWKGEDATRIKNELRVMIGQKPVVSKAKGTAKPKAEPVDRAQRKADAMLVKHAVMRAMFCPYTGAVLDMRRAVVVAQSTGIRVMAATAWDKVKDQFFAHIGPELAKQVKVYDGRELFTPSGAVRYSR